MGYCITKHRGEFCYDVMEFVVDEESDIENLPGIDETEDCPIVCSAGSTAFCIGNKKAYMLNTQNEWKEL